MKKFMYRKNLTRTLALILMVMLCFSALTVTGSAASHEVLPDGSYVIYTQSLRTCWNIGFKATDGGLLITDTAGLSAPSSTTLEDNDIFVLKNVGGGYVSISPRHAPGYYLTGSNGFDRQISIRKSTSLSSIYHWLPIDMGGGAYVFKNRETGYVIDVCNGWNADAGTPILQYHQNGFQAAQFHYPVRISHFTALTPGTRVTNLSSYLYKVGLYYDRNQVWNSQYGLHQGYNLVCDPYNAEANEQIYIQCEGNGLYSLRFGANTNLCIAPPDVFAGTQLKVKTFDGTASCLYEIYKVGSTYSFRNKATGLFVDDLYARTATGTAMISYSFNRDNAQKFYLTGIIKASSSGQSSSQTATSGYAAYTGVDYRQQTNDSRRIAACDKAVKMATILWKADCDFPTWKSSGGSYNTVTSTDGTSSTKFLKGEVYQGIPYSMAGRTYTDTRWRVLVGNGLTTSMMTGKYYTKRADTTAYGIDCSYLVCTALNEGCGTSINLNTKSMLSSSKFTKISRSQMQPGDIFLKSGHVMFFMGKTADGKYAIIEANASYSRVVYRELSSSSLSTYGCYRYNGFC